MYYSVFRDVLVGYQSESEISALGLGKATPHSSAIWTNFEFVFLSVKISDNVRALEMFYNAPMQ